MTKIFKLSFLFLIFSTCFFLFSQEIEDVFDFDDLFANAEDVEAILENTETIKNENTKEEKIPINNEKFSISGNFSADIAFYGQYPKDPYYVGAGAKFSNTLSFLAKASSFLSFHASLYTDEKLLYKPQEAIEIKTFYFDYLFFNTVLLTAGKKSYDWGNPLYFTSNLIDDFDENISFQIIYPLYPFTFSVLGLYTEKISESMNPNKLDLAAAIETILFEINLKAFSRYWSEIENEEGKKIVFGLEWKRDILGLDFYQQALYYVDFPKQWDWENNSFQLISGLAQIWDNNYKIALIIEHKWLLSFEDNTNKHIIALNTGISRLFSGKLKLGLQAEHKIPDNDGKINIAAILPGSSFGFPHADLQFAIPLEYDNKAGFSGKLGANLAISFNY